MRRLFIFFLLVLAASSVQAVDVYLRLMSHGQRTNIGVAGFAPKNATIDEAKLGRQIQNVVRADMLYSRYFDILSDGPLYTGKDEELKDWQDRGAAARHEEIKTTVEILANFGPILPEDFLLR